MTAALFSSASRLATINITIITSSLRSGQITMALFMLPGVSPVFVGNQELFSAVAVSGTASLYLAPVVFFSLWGGREHIPAWSYLACFALAVGGAALYFTESSGHTRWLGKLRKYSKLLYLSLGVLGLGCLLFWLGDTFASRRRTTAASTA